MAGSFRIAFWLSIQLGRILMYRHLLVTKKIRRCHPSQPRFGGVGNVADCPSLHLQRCMNYDGVCPA